MTTKHFESLSIQEKAQVIQTHSTFIHSNTDQDPGYRVNLYSLHHYFVEVRQDAVTKDIASIEIKPGTAD